jgi:hypothetical protein
VTSIGAVSMPILDAFQCDPAVEFFVSGDVDLALAALAKERLGPIA